HAPILHLPINPSLSFILRPLLTSHLLPYTTLFRFVISDITAEKLNLLREADDIFISELRTNGLYDEVWQALAVLLPVQSVGVMGDERTYEYTIARSEEHTSELQSRFDLVCRLLLEKKN